LFQAKQTVGLDGLSSVGLQQGETYGIGSQLKRRGLREKKVHRSAAERKETLTGAALRRM